jgi:DNA modification methylase
VIDRASAPGRLVCADALDVLGALPAGAVDLVYADPPFATGVVRRGRAGGYDDRTPGGLDAYLAWLEAVLARVHHALAAHGSLFLHLDYRAAHHARVALDRVFGAERFVNEIVWCYAVGGKSRRSFGKKHDTILWYARGPEYRFFPDDVRVARRAGSHMKVELDDAGRPVQVKRDRKTGKLYRYPVHAGKVPEDWWADIETLNRGDKERTGWPTQKPEALLERIIRAASAPGELVCDPFSGSGTTAAVAARLGRRFLAADASPEACAITARRLAAAGLPVTVEAARAAGRASPTAR